MQCRTCSKFLQILSPYCVCRCLAIGAPDAEVKLQLLSDIAQEHGVEWDSHRAHQEMVAGKHFKQMAGVEGLAEPPCLVLEARPEDLALHYSHSLVFCILRIYRSLFVALGHILTQSRSWQLGLGTP